MASSVDPVVAKLCMEEEVEESAISTSAVASTLWKRYVDNSFCIINKDEIPVFHNIVNGFDPRFSF